MKSLLITAPILPGKLDAWRRFVAACLGERRAAYEIAMRAAGVTRLRVWHHRGPDGADLAIVVYDGPTPDRFLPQMMGDPGDFGAWFREQGAVCHGVKAAGPLPPMPEIAVDLTA